VDTVSFVRLRCVCVSCCVTLGQNGMSSMFSPQHCMPPLYALNTPYQPVGPGVAPTPYNTPAVCFPNGFQGKFAWEAFYTFLIAEPLQSFSLCEQLTHTTTTATAAAAAAAAAEAVTGTSFIFCVSSLLFVSDRVVDYVVSSMENLCILLQQVFYGPWFHLVFYFTTTTTTTTDTTSCVQNVHLLH